MNRRGFLKLFAGAAVAPVVPKSYFFAPVGGWTSELIAEIKVRGRLKTLCGDSANCSDCYDRSTAQIVRRHSCYAFGVCDDCHEARQVATNRLWR